MQEPRRAFYYLLKGRYSRSQEERKVVVDELAKEPGSEEKVFGRLDDEMWKSPEHEKLGEKADVFIKEKFGIKSAKDRLWERKPQ